MSKDEIKKRESSIKAKAFKGKRKKESKKESKKERKKEGRKIRKKMSERKNLAQVQ